VGPSPCRILELVEEVAQAVPLPENETTVVFKQSSFAVQVMEVDATNFQGQKFVVDVGRDSSKEISLTETSEPTASLAIPMDFFNDVKIPQSLDNSTEQPVPRITNIVFLTDALFSRRNNTNENETVLEVASIILTSSLSVSVNSTVKDVRVANLQPPIILFFTKRPEFENLTNASCNFWDPFADGELNTMLCVCSCESLTRFCRCDCL